MVDSREIMQPNLDELLTLANKIAVCGALVHREGFGRAISQRTKSSELDVVSEIDTKTERVLVEKILTNRPDDSIISEEGNNHQGTTGVCWVIDPLDGTVNYLHGYPEFGISIGVEIENVGTIGIVYDTHREQVFRGITDQYAVCDDKPISASNCRSLQNALIATGFLPNREARIRQGKILTEVLPKVRDIRRSGSPVIDLCRVASGIIDGFYEFGLKRWDMSAGSVIAQAAGAKVTVLQAGGNISPLIVASTPDIHDHLIELIMKGLKNANEI